MKSCLLGPTCTKMHTRQSTCNRGLLLLWTGPRRYRALVKTFLGQKIQKMLYRVYQRKPLYFILLWQVEICKLKLLQNKKGQKHLGYPTKKQSFSLTKDCFFVGYPNFFGPCYFEAEITQYIKCRLFLIFRGQRDC